MPKDRGAEQGDVDGPLQASGSLPWIGVDFPSEPLRLQDDHAVRLQETANFRMGGPDNFTGADNPRHALQQMEAWRTCGVNTTPKMP